MQVSWVLLMLALLSLSLSSSSFLSSSPLLLSLLLLFLLLRKLLHYLRGCFAKCSIFEISKLLYVRVLVMTERSVHCVLQC